MKVQALTLPTEHCFYIHKGIKRLYIFFPDTEYKLIELEKDRRVHS